MKDSGMTTLKNHGESGVRWLAEVNLEGMIWNSKLQSKVKNKQISGHFYINRSQFYRSCLLYSVYSFNHLLLFLNAKIEANSAV